MELHNQSRRPSERTEQFFRDYLEKMACQPGDRLPSPRQVAGELGVSESTVRGVVRKWLKEGILHSRQGSGIFLAQAPPEETAGVPPYRIAANTRRDSTKHFGQQPAVWNRIIHMGALQSIMELGPRASCASLYSYSEEIDALPEKVVLSRCKEVDGFILYLSDPHVATITAHCDEYAKPYVFLNPPNEESTSNFVTLGHITAYSRVVKVLRQSGRRRFAAMVYPDPERSVAIRQRISGMLSGIGVELGSSIELRILSCDSYHEADGYRAMKELLAKGDYKPDAILCAGDALALGAMDALKEHSISVPEEVALISGAGFDPKVEACEITTFVHPIHSLGHSLVQMLTYMLDHKLCSIPGRFLPIGLRGGRTTTAEESALLLKAFQAKEDPFAASYRAPKGATPVE